MNCPSCQGEFETAGAGMYNRCKKCFSIFMNLNGTLTPYPSEEGWARRFEQSQDVLDALADEALSDSAESRTTEVDPNKM
ncbi:MAG TPA: hypothetical protein VHO06_17575 [Polyangia bacterium]|nr:hypothetical protein [Polyangia bacterium]